MSPEALKEIERNQIEESRFKARTAIYQAREAEAKADLAELILARARKAPATITGLAVSESKAS